MYDILWNFDVPDLNPFSDKIFYSYNTIYQSLDLFPEFGDLLSRRFNHLQTSAVSSSILNTFRCREYVPVLFAKQY